MAVLQLVTNSNTLLHLPLILSSLFIPLFRLFPFVSPATYLAFLL